MSWATLIGRFGMVLLMTGLALGLVSIIPSAQVRTYSEGMGGAVAPETYEFSLQFSLLTPQSGIHISVESNSSFDFYLLNVFTSQFQNWTMAWVKERFPNLQEYELRWASHNMTVFNAVLESNQDIVLWKSKTTNKISEDFFPPTVSNVTGIIANPSLNVVEYKWEITSITSLAPKARVVLLTQLLIPIGAVLAIPWVYSTRVRKPKLQQ